MRLPPAGQLQLVFHRGAKVRDDAEAFAFEDDTGLLTWPAPDRATLTLSTPDELEARLPVVVELVERWMTATAPAR